MPHRNFALAIVVLFGLNLFTALSAGAAPFDNNPKILLHLKPVTAKNACNAGLLADCATATTSGSTITGSGPYYFVYVLAAKGAMTDVAGVQFGVMYQDGQFWGQQDGQKLDIFAWVNCATLEFPMTNWPGPRTGNLVTWDATARCQVGETAVAGYFYLGAYAADQLKLVPRQVDDRALLADCGAIERTLSTQDLGWVEFSNGAMTAGCNPCVELCGEPFMDVTPPNAVLLSLHAVATTSLRVGWVAPDEDGEFGIGRPATSYDLRISNAPLTETNFLDATAVTPMPTPETPRTTQVKIVNGLTPTTTYYLALRSADEAGNWSPISNNVQVTTTGLTDVTPPATTTNLAIADTLATSFLLTWTAPGDDGLIGQATTYEIRYSLNPITSGNFSSAAIAPNPPFPASPGTTENYLLLGLAEDTRYYVALLTRDEFNNTSGLSNVVTAYTLSSTPDTTPPAAIIDLIVTNSFGTTVTLEWTAPGDDSLSRQASVYDVRRASSPITPANFLSATQVSGEPIPTLPGTRQEMNVVNVPPGTHYFAMRTGDEVPNWSGISNVVQRTTGAGTGDPRLMLHVTTPVTKNQCANGQLADCHDAVTRGNLASVGGGGPFYFVYLMVIQFGEIAGVQCGIDYDQGRVAGDANHEAIDVLSWNLCAQIEFQSPTPSWPKPRSGNLMTWQNDHCQSGATAVAGYFYVAAYSPDILQIIPRPVDALAKTANCESEEHIINPTFLGTARFSNDPNLKGFNPCGVGSSVNIQPSTWSRIKTLTGK